MTDFVRRQLTITFRLASGSFADGNGSNTLTLTGVRASAKIQNAGGASMGIMQLSVYGMTLSQMNDLSTLGMLVNLVPRNEVLVAAGDEGATASTVFVGNILNAWPDLGAAPNVPFRVEAASLGASAVLSAKPSSFTGSADVATILSGLANQMGAQFENNGVNAKLSGQYLYGSARDQALKVVQIAGIEWNAGDGGVLAIWPRGGSRGDSGFTLSPATGMVGYPTFTQNGIQVRTVFNPAISFGKMITVQSTIKSACQTVKVMGLDHDLDALDPSGGTWFSTIKGYSPTATVKPS